MHGPLQLPALAVSCRTGLANLFVSCSGVVGSAVGAEPLSPVQERQSQALEALEGKVPRDAICWGVFSPNGPLQQPSNSPPTAASCSDVDLRKMPNNPRPAWHRRYGVNSQQARLPFTDGGMQLITTPQRSERDGKKGTTKRTSKASSSLARVGVLCSPCSSRVVGEWDTAAKSESSWNPAWLRLASSDRLKIVEKLPCPSLARWSYSG